MRFDYGNKGTAWEERSSQIIETSELNVYVQPIQPGCWIYGQPDPFAIAHADPKLGPK